MCFVSSFEQSRFLLSTAVAFFSRNIGWATPKITNVHYVKKNFSGSKYLFIYFWKQKHWSTGVILFYNLNQIFLGHSDPLKTFQYNENKWLSAWHNRYTCWNTNGDQHAPTCCTTARVSCSMTARKFPFDTFIPCQSHMLIPVWEVVEIILHRFKWIGDQCFLFQN